VTAFIQKPIGTRELIRAVAGALGDKAEERMPLRRSARKG